MSDHQIPKHKYDPDDGPVIDQLYVQEKLIAAGEAIETLKDALISVIDVQRGLMQHMKDLEDSISDIETDVRNRLDAMSARIATFEAREVILGARKKQAQKHAKESTRRSGSC